MLLPKDDLAKLIIGYKTELINLMTRTLKMNKILKSETQKDTIKSLGELLEKFSKPTISNNENNSAIRNPPVLEIASNSNNNVESMAEETSAILEVTVAQSPPRLQIEEISMESSPILRIDLSEENSPARLQEGISTVNFFLKLEKELPRASSTDKNISPVNLGEKEIPEISLINWCKQHIPQVKLSASTDISTAEVNSFTEQTTNETSTDFASHVRRAQKIIENSSKSASANALSNGTKKTKCRFCARLIATKFLELHLRSKHTTPGLATVNVFPLNGKRSAVENLPVTPTKPKIYSTFSTLTPVAHSNGHGESTDASPSNKRPRLGLNETFDINQLSTSPKKPSAFIRQTSVKSLDNAGAVVRRNSADARSTVLPDHFSMITCTICNNSIDRNRFASHMQQFHNGSPCKTKKIDNNNSAPSNKSPFRKPISVIGPDEVLLDGELKREFVCCKWCGKMVRYSVYRSHVRKVHNSAGCRFKCGVCMDGFLSAKACRIHMSRRGHVANIVKMET